MTPELISYIEHMAAYHPHYRTMRGEFDGKTIWIKHHTCCKKNVWHGVQNMLSKLIPLAICKTTVSNFDSIEQEANRIRDFKQRGAAVADVLYARPGLFAVSDVGPQLRDTLKKTDDSNEQQQLIELAARSLSDLHHLNLCHGRPALKDMTLQNGHVHFIDLEEDPLKVMTLAQAQARDIWLFLISCVPYVLGDAEELLKIYQITTQNISAQTLRELTRAVRFLKPIRIIAEYAIAPFTGKDLIRAVIVNKMLERVL